MVDQLTNVLSWWSEGVAGQVVLVVATVTTAVIIWFIISKIQTRGNLRPLPGPRGLPVVGYLPFIGSDLRWAFRDLAAIYGPIFKFRLGTKDCVVVSSTFLAKEVLKDKDVIFAYRNATVAGKLASFGGSDIGFSDYGPAWRKMKKIVVSDMLRSVNSEAGYYHRKKNVQKMINKTYSKAGELIDIGDLIFFTIFSSLMSMIWGETMKGEDVDDTYTEFRSAVGDYMLLVGAPNISDYLPFLAWLDLQGIKKKMELVCGRIEKLFDVAIDRHNAAGGNSQKDFLGCLLQRTKLKDDSTSLSLRQVRGILGDVIVGGVETTSSTLEWAMAELLKHPKIMKIAQEELAETVGLNNTVEETHLPKLKYVNAVLKETLRLHAPAPFLLPHRSSMATSVGGYEVPKNSMTFINAWSIHRDPKYWEAPLEFQPERFSNASENLDFTGNNYNFLPFGSGRRMCVGITLAEKMSMFMLSSLLHSFEWALPDGTEYVDDLSDTFGASIKKSKPTMAVPTPRLSKFDLYSNE